MAKKTTLFILVFLLILMVFNRQSIQRLYEGYLDNKKSHLYSKYYQLDDKIAFQDITEKLIADKSIPIDLKQPLINKERRIVIFKYPSDNEIVAGYASLITNGYHPTLIFLRGGNGFYGIMRPNNRFSFLKNYNVIGTLYRGNIYGGRDEIGGTDLNDVESLLKFIPKIEKFTDINLTPPYTMMGVSRGSMEMFLALGQSDYVRSLVKNAISVSGNLDLTTSIQKRPEMRYLFNSQSNNQRMQFDEWIKSRNPTDNVKNLPKSLHVLLIYGLSDNRVSLAEQINFKKMLDEYHIDSELVTIPNANHGLDNHYPEFENIVTRFLSKK